ncbi:MAG: L-threonylcarbamoyladenylate synthase [Candidatus Omnitrophica bacterium]|nr:L-threonylcarbamoyladenylate synthase [Candidatus Omnitrophota bacterium]
MVVKTKVIKLNPLDIDQEVINQAATIIKKGGLVAFPTETVYGLGADALNPKAVEKIFEVKKRPHYDPLIVHIPTPECLSEMAREVNKVILDLTAAFWPGPLTLVVKKAQHIPDVVTANLDTVAIRMPAHPVALALLKTAATPIAAPSANLFGRASPVSAEHVLQDLQDKIELILDAGKTDVGVESTILDVTQRPFRILRPGGITIEALRAVVADIVSYQGNQVLSPGMFKRHYSPKARLVLAYGRGLSEVESVKHLASEFAKQGYLVGIMAKEENRHCYNGSFNVKVFGSEKDLSSCAVNLYSILREFDKENTQIIIAETVKEEGLGVAIMDRLRRAAARTSE